MPELPPVIRRLAGHPSLDMVLAAAVAAAALSSMAIHGDLRSVYWSGIASVVAGCGVFPLRRVRPLLAATLSGVAAALPGLLGSLRVAEATPKAVVVTGFFIAYTLGVERELPEGVIGAAILLVGLQIGGRVFNPFFEMVCIGPLVAGRTVAARRDLTRRLEARNRELEEERERFAQEAVRYERAWIARELHDIVAHAVSAIVVQAGAGQRLADAEPALAAEALDVIGRAADSAQAEIGRLAQLLDSEADEGESGVEMIGRLVQQAAATGLAVDLRMEGSCSLARAGWDAAYRVAQEGLTNALKHAPGARVRVALEPHGPAVRLSIRNGPGSAPRSGLEAIGGGHGNVGMNDRVVGCGGSFRSGPTPEGGWEVEALFPRVTAVADGEVGQFRPSA